MIKLQKILAVVVLCPLFLVSAVAIADDAEQTEKRHPSYQLLGRDAPPPADSPLNPNFVVADEASITEGALWKSSYIPERLVALDVADLDNDGQNELVYASLRNIYVTRRSGPVLQQLATYSLNEGTRIISLDLYDIDSDGSHEVIVSAQSNNNHPVSCILKFDGSKTLVELARAIPWYLRVVGESGHRRLAVQKGAISSGQTYSGSVQYATLNEGKINTIEAVPLPSNINLYNFNIGSLGANKTRFTAAIKFPSEHLFLFESNGDKAWESHDEYAGTVNFIQKNTIGDSNKDIEYLPSRIILTDIDNDGSNELIVAKNNQGGVPFMKNMRAFNGGIIEARKFVNLSLTPFFSSRNLLPGPAIDYQLADFDNNGTKDLVVAVVIEQGSGMLEDARSIIVAYSDLYSTADKK